MAAGDKGFPGLHAVKDPLVRQALQNVFRELHRVQGGAGSDAQFQGSLDTRGQRIKNLPTPSASADAATKGYVDSTAAPATLQKALSAAGAAPLNVNELPGRLKSPQDPRVILIPKNKPLPPLRRYEPYAMVLSGTDGFFYYHDPGPPAAWVPIVPGTAPSTPGGTGSVGGPGTCGGLSNSPDCPRLCSGGTFAGAIDNAQSTVENSLPDLFDDPLANPLVIKEGSQGQYRDEVVLQLNSGIYGLVAQTSALPQEITVADDSGSPAFSEHYAIFASSREPRRNPGSYRATCTPSRFE